MHPQQKPVQPVTLRGVVERAFYFQGKALKIGDEVTLPRLFALEMEAVKKLRLLKEPPAPAPVKQPDTAKKDKEVSNAR